MRTQGHRAVAPLTLANSRCTGVFAILEKITLQMEMDVSLSSPYASPYDDLCQGARDPNRYVIAMNVAAAKVKRRFGTASSDGLDLINAFDLAEVERMCMGQINMIEVSSFCGPEGYIWGEDVAAASDPREVFVVRQWDGSDVPVHDGEPLVLAARSLFGTVDEKRFPLAPGSHCPTAHKSVCRVGPARLYAACGIGVRGPSGGGATILMEDAGVLAPEMAADPTDVRSTVLRSLAESIMAIAENQRILCRRVYVAFASVAVGADEAGCALSMVPYFSLARRALPPGGIEALKKIDIAAWERGLTH